MIQYSWEIPTQVRNPPRGDEGIMEMLLDRDANVNAKEGCCPPAIQLASGSGHERIVQMLLDRGADINAQSKSRHQSALEAAQEAGYGGIVKLLLDHLPHNLSATAANNFRGDVGEDG